MTIKVVEDTMLRESITGFVESIGEQLTEFLEVLTEEYEEPSPTKEFQELCKSIKGFLGENINPDISINNFKHKKNRIGF